MANKYFSVFVTAASAAEAKKIADKALKSKLAACASIIRGVESFYWWKGRIRHSGETMIIMKTKAGHMKKLIDTVKKAHSYEVPEIVALPIVSGSMDYLDWIEKSV